ncbi:hypothetical protein A3D11_00980 [Candidatus Peribacteria bacterium RIFCSPHIGHO2_02_FULL_49_16]|nr:MAG: hypothetical protein A2880_03595 [Candidatus Peribacteria bacterium RIFCSPHIGHO2_01_FULL_49_38]OGJ60156.1 MAG: hypothetical protein A3D11_00980 [Candidatus Peribacteria bacterium RIFCSPHIGHO2_02_FULL_49_16]
MLDPKAIRSQFPLLLREISGEPIVYLDSAATSQKPDAVLEAMMNVYRTSNANAHRGMHPLAEEATQQYEKARATVQKFLNAKYAEEIVFTKSCTEAINLVAHTVSQQDHIVLSLLEHHSNIIPWMQRDAHIHWTNLSDLEEILRTHTISLVAITGQSNVLGIRPPIEEIIQLSHAAGAKVLVDAAQLVAHHPIHVQKLDCDFLTFSSHKLYGPTGIGVLYAKRECLEEMSPMLGGGGMVYSIAEQSFTPLGIPEKFEAGTPPVADAIGLATAIDWLAHYDWKDIEEYEQHLLRHAEEVLTTIPGLTILNLQPHSAKAPRGDLQPQSGCISFTLAAVHPHDLTEILGRQGICLRAGHHCAQPIHKHLGIAASTRLSVGIYNTIEEINLLPSAIEHAQHVLATT